MRLATKDEHCSGCRTCLLVCSLENQGHNNPKFGLLRIRGLFPEPGRYEVKVCTECGTCRDVCPVEAIYEVDGYLRVDKSLCTRCLACVQACPEGVMTIHKQWDATEKCCHCGACAEYCPTGAIYDADTIEPDQAWRITRQAAKPVAENGGANSG